MEHLKKIGAGFLDSVTATRTKIPPDDLMVSCKKQLSGLRDEIFVVKQQFSQYAHQVVEAAEASVTLSKSVDRFYSRANHPGRSESVNMYKKVQEDIANNAVKTFHITVENGLISELAEWIQTIADVHEKISAAESTRITAHDTQNRLLSLQSELKDKKSSKKTLFGGSRESDIDDLQQRISESSEAQKSLSSEYNSQRNNIAQSVQQLMEKRYRYFDRIYVQMLECQAEFFQHAATVSKRFQRDIDYYRKQYPKTNEFHTNNGSVHSLDGDLNMHDEAQGLLSSPNATVTTSVTPTISTEIDAAKNKPKIAPKQAPRENVPPETIISNGNHDKLSPQKQGSTHDILNLAGPMPISPQLPKPKKQDSLLTGLFGNDVGHDPHDLFNLVNPHRNDMLNMNVEKQKNDLEHKNGGGEDDIFGDFFGSKHNINKAPHGSQDSTTDWILGSHEPAVETIPINVQKRDKSMEEQMRNTFNAPSYNGHNSQLVTATPILNSETDGADDLLLSAADKQKMVHMKLSRKGKENARKVYDSVMKNRKQEEEKVAGELREKMYWKDKHEQKLNEWEFENTVRRNIRTLIGKLPEVLPSNLNWKSIPMTKLLNDATLKKGYYKAVRVVHPDKSIGRGDSVEDKVICDYVFQALEQAFNTKFG